jgi:hypothetical protein
MGFSERPPEGACESRPLDLLQRAYQKFWAGHLRRLDSQSPSPGLTAPPNRQGRLIFGGGLPLVGWKGGTEHEEHAEQTRRSSPQG